MKIEYPPPCTHEIWNYNKADTDLINRFIENVEWSNLSLGKSEHEQVDIFNQTILNIFHNFIQAKLLCAMTKTLSGWIKKSNEWLGRKMSSIVAKGDLLILTTLL